MNEFIEKLIGRLEEGIYSFEERLKFDAKTQKHLISQNNGIKYAITIVNELAEEYKLFGNSEQVNGGWIPCSERLPEEDGVYLITLSDGVDYLTIPADFISNHTWHKWWKIDSEWIYYDDVTAWQPLPEPYKGGAE